MYFQKLFFYENNFICSQIDKNYFRTITKRYTNYKTKTPNYFCSSPVKEYNVSSCKL